ncbi:CU044_5270 family protein [Streptomyces sp. S3(2020)]|uniref:CU044_5270 family protein n=1 Tax=Streptomyces sp. S3(2020) TaxID=2732044 RepID=UPI001487DD6A|nr:CU044_5270 family protein [Streptomyces sp. S3(2020)]NNN30125.1 CU044_5270 family protein [Streptomyces sp. S3(2020)]
MADELELLRRANPVPADAPHFGDGPLDHHAERRLNRLMRQRTSRRPRLLWGLAATAVVGALVAALLFTDQTTAPAVAAPRPLVVQADSTPVSLETLAARARARAAGGSPALRKGTHVKSWSMGMSEDKPPITYPEERIVRWNADDSHTETVDDGHDRTTRTYPPSWSDAPPQSPPPLDVTRLRAYLQETLHIDTAPDTGQLLDGVGVLLDHWTLGARESAVLVQLLADAEGLKPVGQVTDRLGRRGQAYVYEQSVSRQMLIMDPATGAVLGLETTFTEADPEYGVKAGDVMDYSAWMR